MERKYFFFDIDGTLAAGSADLPVAERVPASALKALAELRARGHFLALATGRLQVMAVDYLEHLGFDHMVADGGYSLTVDHKLVDFQPIDRAAALDLIAECDARGLPWSISPANDPFRHAPDGRFAACVDENYMPTRVFPGLDPASFERIYKVYVACPPGTEDTLVALKRLQWCRYTPGYIFVEPCEKAVGIRKMVEMVGGNVKDVVVFGDARNDLSMFVPEWTSIAMGNAVPELKARATYVTDPVDRDGLYNACRHFGWI